MHDDEVPWRTKTASSSSHSCCSISTDGWLASCSAASSVPADVVGETPRSSAHSCSSSTATSPAAELAPCSMAERLSSSGAAIARIAGRICAYAMFETTKASAAMRSTRSAGCSGSARVPRYICSSCAIVASSQRWSAHASHSAFIACEAGPAEPGVCSPAETKVSSGGSSVGFLESHVE